VELLERVAKRPEAGGRKKKRRRDSLRKEEGRKGN
jgi:hypothetical protein